MEYFVYFEFYELKSRVKRSANNRRRMNQRLLKAKEEPNPTSLFQYTSFFFIRKVELCFFLFFIIYQNFSNIVLYLL